MGPSERLVAAAVARDYYLGGLSKKEIGLKHQISRFKVARILEESLESGLVRIQIDDDPTVDTSLSEGVKHRYGLKHALVVHGVFSDDNACRAAIGKVAAELSQEVTVEHDILGVAWGRTIDVVAETEKSLPGCRVVQMTGVAGSVESSSVNLVRRFARASGGVSLPIYAPLIVSDGQALDVFKRQTEISQAISQWQEITLALVAIGSAAASGSQVNAILAETERDMLREKGMVGEICAQPIAVDGTFIPTSLEKRTLSIPFQMLQNIPEVIAVAGGDEKHVAILAALRSRVVTSLVTDRQTAEFLLS